MISGIILIKTNYSFRSNDKPGYIFAPLNNLNKNYIIFSNSKVLKSSNDNLYCIISLTEKKLFNNIQIAKLENIIGPVNLLSNQIDSLLYYSDQFQIKKYNNIIEPGIFTIYNNLLNDLKVNNDYDVISIDPLNCRDIDDAVSYIDENNFIIHIADPNKFHEIYPLTDYYNNYTSLYLQLKTLHLLPEMLSTNIISLIENTIRPVISIYFRIENDIPEILSIKRQNIKITKNMTYDEADNYINKENIINNLFKIGKKLENIYYTEDKILKDSHDMVELFMLLTNHKIGEFITNNINNSNNKILYRTVIDNQGVYSWNNLLHDKLNIYNYVHFTSPIRRTADFITHQLLLKCLNYEVNNEYKITDIDTYNNYLSNIKLISNRAKYLTVADKIINGNQYNCKLIKINETNFTWYIHDFDIKFTCEFCKPEFINQFEKFIFSLKINESYNIKLYKIFVTKFKIIKLMFEFVL